jgi:hypothetical protein
MGAKLCGCGCGNYTTFSKCSRSDRGYKRGDPLKFIKGHRARLQGIQTKEQFWDKVKIFGEDKCWEWSGWKKKGYGHLTYQGKKWRAHKLAFILSGGVLTKYKRYVLHKCDNPCCCNPMHLYAGSNQDNMRDRDKRGRQFRKLSNTDIINIRIMCAKKEFTQRYIAKIFAVSASTVSAIKLFRKHKFLPSGQ